MKPAPEQDYYTAVHATAFDDNAEVQSLFEQHLGPEVNAALLGITSGYRAYRELEEKVVLDVRAAYVEAYAFTALNSLITSTHLLVSGTMVPSGNLMRQYGEAIAMALLCSEPKLKVYEKLKADPKKYPVHKCIDLLGTKKVQDTLGLNPKELANFQRLSKFFGNYSHASQLGVGSQFIFSKPGWLGLGGAFALAKIEQYRRELSWRRTAGELLRGVAAFCAERLPQKPLASKTRRLAWDPNSPALTHACMAGITPRTASASGMQADTDEERDVDTVEES
jgi:hypothetical protein